jgi:hypothetical protein
MNDVAMHRVAKAAMKGQQAIMVAEFKLGDHVAWNYEGGRASGTIIKIHTQDTDFKRYTHHASAEAPQYEIQSDKTDHIAMHKGAALKKLRI